MDRSFFVAMRCTSTAHFLPEDKWTVNVLTDDGRTTALTFLTEWIEVGLESPLPGSMLVEAVGMADSAQSALDDFWELPPQFCIAIAFACNSYVSMPRRHIAIETTPGVEELQFVQARLVEMPHPGIGYRQIRPEELNALIPALECHASRGRLMRSLEHYRRALDHWSAEEEWIATAHLFIAAEILSLVCLREAAEAGGLEPDDYSGLAQSLGIQVSQPHKAKSEIAAWFRRERVFHGDTDTHREAKKASDGFEHGYLEFPQLQKHAGGAALATFKHIRQTILETLDVPQPVQERLLARAPLDTKSFTDLVEGHFVGPLRGLAAAGERHPFLEWERNPAKAWRDDEGGFHCMYPCTVGPLHCADGVECTITAVGGRHVDRAGLKFGEDLSGGD
jgi:hypothetical protein